MGHWTGAAKIVIVAAIVGAVVSTVPGDEAPTKKPAAPGPGANADSKEPAAPASLRFLPKSRRMSTFDFEGRFEITARDVSFEAPDAYKEGFSFWAGRMKGQKRSEVCQIVTITQDADDHGLVSFRRTIPKYDVEIERQGEVLTPGGNVEKSVATLQWEGTFDVFGNVKEMRKVAGKDDEEITALAIPEMSRLFPDVDGPRDLKIGEGFKEERVVRLPSKLGIAGLEKLTIQWTREYTLKSFGDGIAVFEVKTTYATDPAFKADTDKTTCRISGGGSGEALFEIRRGVFVRSRQPTSMHIDLEAPLRPLPNHPETDAGTLGKSHIDLDLLLSGQQTVRRVWGEEPD